ncbi:MAG: N-acetyltransferase family protein [Burkholderiaceae bacterium]
MSMIRPSQAQDVAAIAAIYALHVHSGTGTFEVDAPSEPEIAARRADVLEKGLPYLVAEVDGKVVGFAYCNWFKPRPAYRFSAEDSIYLAAGAQGQGLGRALLAELMVRAQRAGTRKLIAVIGDSRNTGSIAVHRSAGFTQVGVLKSCGWKFDQWLDVVLMERALGFGDQMPPESPV